MRASICCISALMGAMGIAADAAVVGEIDAGLAGKRLSPIITPATKAHVIGVCSPSPNNQYSAENGLAPLTSAQAYFRLFERRSVTGSATTTILQQPKHGVLRLVTEADRGTLFGRTADPLDLNANLYAYLPEPGYLGTDTGSILVDFGGGNKVEVRYFFHAVEGPLGSDWAQNWCSDTNVYWKISSTLDANGNSTISSVEYVTPAPSAPDTLTSAWLSLAHLDAKVADMSGFMSSLNTTASTE